MNQSGGDVSDIVDDATDTHQQCLQVAQEIDTQQKEAQTTETDVVMEPAKMEDAADNHIQVYITFDTFEFNF